MCRLAKCDLIVQKTYATAQCWKRLAEGGEGIALDDVVIVAANASLQPTYPLSCQQAVGIQMPYYVYIYSSCQTGQEAGQKWIGQTARQFRSLWLIGLYCWVREW